MVAWGIEAALVNLTGASYPDQLPAAATGLRSAAGLTGLYAAVAGRASAAAVILALGDSIEAGQGSTSWLGTWVQQASVMIRDMYPTATGLASVVAGNPMGGQGFISVLPTSGSLTYSDQGWGAVTGGSGSADVGPVRNALLMAGTSTSVTYTAPAGQGTTSVRLVHFGQGGTYSWTKNSGSANNVVTPSDRVDHLGASVTMTAGDTLKIQWVSGQVVFDGLIHYAGDETSGVSFWNLGHSGWKASDWIAAENLEGADWAQALAVLAPAAILIGLGGNDAQSQTVAVFAANLQALITLIRAQSGLSTIPVIFHTTYAANATAIDPGGWPAYVAAIRTVAAANLYTQVIDTNYRWPAYSADFGGDDLYYTAGGPGGVGVHPSNLGHALFAGIITSGIRAG